MDCTRCMGNARAENHWMAVTCIPPRGGTSGYSPQPSLPSGGERLRMEKSEKLQY
ncbi:MAG: hypothetical protein LVT47_09520 [Cyanobacteria bacterium LVE1205-1]